MEFSNRKAKCKKVQIADTNGVPQPEVFYALITDEVTQEGTPLNAENMNKVVEQGQVGIDILRAETIQQTGALQRVLGNLRDATTGQISSLQEILNNIFNISPALR